MGIRAAIQKALARTTAHSARSGFVPNPRGRALPIEFPLEFQNRRFLGLRLDLDGNVETSHLVRLEAPGFRPCRASP